MKQEIKYDRIIGFIRILYTVYANIALSLETIAKEIKKEIKNARSINGTITMADISPMFGVLENQINNSLSQGANQRISIILDKNYENVK